VNFTKEYRMKGRDMSPFLLLLSCLWVGNAWGYEGPRPLRDIKIGVSVSSTGAGVFSYQYSVSNPSKNDGSIYSFYLFLGQDPGLDSSEVPSSLKQCPRFSEYASEQVLKNRNGTEVGSMAPPGWDCGYGNLRGFSSVSYGWGAEDNPSLIVPGKSLTGFALTSYGLPAIRDALVQPWIELDHLPQEYSENALKTAALKDKVRWLGKTIGPKFPSKAFVPAGFLDYMISIKDQSVSLGWIKGKHLENELDEIFKRAKRNLGPCEQRELKEDIKKLVEKFGERRCDGVSGEARALFLYNAKYFLAQLPQPSREDRSKCERGHEHEK
jgi:hypothetical protein